VTNVIDKLVESGYVERVAHERDRRAVLARITPTGKRVARRATKRLNEAGFGMAPLDRGACDEIYSLLEPLRRAAGDFTESGG
jgi:DNA-binding MarR family transcriptional regulator